MRAFTFENATKIYFGGGCVKEHLLEAVKPYGETVMLAYGGGSIKTNGIYQEVMDVLKLAGKQVIEFSGIMPNPTYSKVMEGKKNRTGKSGRSDSGSGRRFGHGLQQGDLNGGCDGQGRLGGILDQKGRD